MLEKHILQHPDESPVVRRFWPGEADREGVIIPKGRSWVFSYAPGESDDEALFHLEDHPIQVGQYLTVTEADGEKLMFRRWSAATIDRAGRKHSMAKRVEPFSMRIRTPIRRATSTPLPRPMPQVRGRLGTRCE